MYKIVHFYITVFVHSYIIINNYYENIIDNKEDCVPVYPLSNEKDVKLMKQFLKTIGENNYALTMEESRKEGLKAYYKLMSEEGLKSDAEICLKYKEDYTKYLKYVAIFGYFIRYNDLEEEWLNFRDKALLEPAREFCEKHGIDYYIDENIIGTGKVKVIDDPEVKRLSIEFNNKKEEKYYASLCKNGDKQD